MSAFDSVASRITVERATPGDALALTRLSKRAFDNDVKYGAPSPGGPYGYDARDWQARYISLRYYWRILRGQTLIGGAVVALQSPTHAEIHRIFIMPEIHNLGYGTAAMHALEAQFSNVRVWSLVTPTWNARTQHFYERLGYRHVVTMGDQKRYEKRIPAPDSKADATEAEQ